MIYFYKIEFEHEFELKLSPSERGIDPKDNSSDS
jgi:hypothetical protein